MSVRVTNLQDGELRADVEPLVEGGEVSTAELVGGGEDGAHVQAQLHVRHARLGRARPAQQVQTLHLAVNDVGRHR